MSSLSRSESNSSPEPQPDWVAIVREKVADLQYGVVQIVVHDGRVIQIERNEKTRLGGPRPSGSAL
jgi:hypothetical protein